MILIAILVGLAALFVGWSLGPLGEKLWEKLQKVPEQVQASAKKSQEEAKKGNEYQLPFIAEYVTPEHHENVSFNRFYWMPVLLLVPILFALIFDHSLWWKITIGIILLICWKELLGEIGAMFSVVFGGGEKKKK